MSEQVPPSVPPIPPGEPQITPEQLEMMKRIAKERAIQQIAEQQAAAGAPRQVAMAQAPMPPRPPAPPQQQVVYVRRPLTVAEIIIVFAISIGIVSGGQLIWHGLTNVLPRVEIRMK